MINVMSACLSFAPSSHWHSNNVASASPVGVSMLNRSLPFTAWPCNSPHVQKRFHHISFACTLSPSNVQRCSRSWRWKNGILLRVLRPHMSWSVNVSRRNGSAVGTGYESGFSGSGGSLALILGIALFFISRCDNAIWNHALGSGVWRRVASKSRKYLASTFMALTIILGSCLLRYFFDNLAFTMSLYTYSCTLSCFTLCTYSFL